ncbi:hypothetical protein BT69DRAFT_554221 [Atractiella rhizophila]|nr:hypothetical protein BT69DRAFT_554221 [Atractiella rhizophila]
MIFYDRQDGMCEQLPFVSSPPSSACSLQHTHCASRILSFISHLSYLRHHSRHTRFHFASFFKQSQAHLSRPLICPRSPSLWPVLVLALLIFCSVEVSLRTAAHDKKEARTKCSGGQEREEGEREASDERRERRRSLPLPQGLSSPCSCSLVTPQHCSTLPASQLTFAARATKRESSAREALEAKGDTRERRPASTQYLLAPSHFPLCRNHRPAALRPGSLSLYFHVPLVIHRPPLFQQPLCPPK